MNQSIPIKVSKQDGKYQFRPVPYDKSVLYIYKAYLTKIVDGDTITADIDLGFTISHYQSLRLSSLNAPERGTPEGKKAKEFIENQLHGAPWIVVKTYNRDMYARYVSDIFYTHDTCLDMPTIVEQGHFLNQELLDSGLAQRYYMY